MNVPKLRFKEFNDEWTKYKLNDFLDLLTDYDANGSFADMANNVKTYDTQNYAWYVRATDLENNSPLDKVKYTDKESYDFLKKTALYGDEVLMAKRGNIGNVYYFKSKTKYATLGPNCYLLKTNNKIDNYFLYSYFKSTNGYKKLNRLNASSTLGALYKDDVKNINLIFPEKKEQSKISRTLELLDKKIELQSKKIEDLKLFKLCINNILFNGNKTIKLKDICECKSSTISLSDIEYDDGMYPIYGANGEIKKINSYQNDKDYLAIIKDGAGVGKTIICNKKSSIIATLSALIPNGIPVYYFNELINKIDFSKYIVGSGIPHIYFKDYSNEKLYLHEEKKRVLINNLFKRIIIKIELEENKLHLLETVKKGLMQNMFV